MQHNNNDEMFTWTGTAIERGGAGVSEKEEIGGVALVSGFCTGDFTMVSRVIFTHFRAREFSHAGLNKFNRASLQYYQLAVLEGDYHCYLGDSSIILHSL